MQTLTADYQIVTPLFIGGANRDDKPDIRPPSIKGALRFWWRAIQWGRCLQASENNADQALSLLYQEEAELFGAAVRDKKYGQGLCAIKLKGSVIKGEEETWPQISDQHAGYLGYGLDKTTDEIHRKGVQQGATFTVQLILKARITTEQIQQLKDTLLIWGLLGGLGSRARRGFGSVAITKLEDCVFDFKNTDDYVKAIKKQIDRIQLAPSLPIFTALNQSLQIVTAGEHTDYKRLMNQLGAAYKDGRSEAKGINKRPFGLPLADDKLCEDKRRSSPLLMHIHKTNAGYVAVISFIPADFHKEIPAGKTLDFYQPIKNYLTSVEKVSVYP